MCIDQAVQTSPRPKWRYTGLDEGAWKTGREIRSGTDDRDGGMRNKRGHAMQCAPAARGR
eukprot:7323357-Pyramimonas_sp.AAC.1